MSFELRLPEDKIQHNTCAHSWQHGTRRGRARGRNWSHCWDTCPMQHQLYALVASSFGNCSICYTWQEPLDTTFDSTWGHELILHGGDAFCRAGMGHHSSPVRTQMVTFTLMHQEHLDVGQSLTVLDGSKLNGRRIGRTLTSPLRSWYLWQQQQLFGGAGGRGNTYASIRTTWVLLPSSIVEQQRPHCLRRFSFCAAYFRFHFSAQHIPGTLNTAADAISRDIPLFFSLVPQATQFTVTPSLFQLLIATRPDWGSPIWTQLFIHSLHEGSPSQQ